MSALKSTCAALALTLLNALAVHAGTVHTMDYATPAYVDFEFSEITTEANAKTVVVNLSRTGDFRESTTIEYVTEEGTAVEGKDYKGCGGTLTFKPGEGYKSISIDLLTNERSETNKTFQIKLTAGANTLLMRDSATILIKDAPAPVVPPKLEIALSPDSTIVLSWSGSPNAILERSADPSNGNWENVPCTPVTTEGRCEVKEPAAELFYAYRLKQND
jgi:hypothetical protein